MFTELALRMLIALQELGARARDERAQTLAEYSLIISLVGVTAMVTGVIVFRDALVEAFNDAARCLNGAC